MAGRGQDRALPGLVRPTGRDEAQRADARLLDPLDRRREPGVGVVDAGAPEEAERLREGIAGLGVEQGLEGGAGELGAPRARGRGRASFDREARAARAP